MFSLTSKRILGKNCSDIKLRVVHIEILQWSLTCQYLYKANYLLLACYLTSFFTVRGLLLKKLSAICFKRVLAVDGDVWLQLLIILFRAML